jgi:class 3 adenylate cyclase
MEENRVLTIVFTDIKGFTERTSSIDREAVSQLLKKHEELLLPLVASYDGRLIKTIGDAFLLTFASPTNAVLCAVMMQEKLKEFNAGQPEIEKIEIRVAINTGEVLMRDGDVFGEPVNIAARIEGLTEANEVWFSESTYLAMNRKEVPTSLIGEYRLKGIPEAVKVYRVVRDPTIRNTLKLCTARLSVLKCRFLPETFQ